MIYTIGHSTRSEIEFIALLQHYQIAMLADIRTIPRSKWNPQFNRATLERSLTQAGMKYLHIPDLGGLREPDPNSVNLGLQHRGFRGYADHMQSAGFEEALSKLIQLASKQRTALMCAEAAFEKCHRRLTSDALTVRKVEVLHILNKEQLTAHVLTPFVHVEETRITYLTSQSELEF